MRCRICKTLMKIDFGLGETGICDRCKKILAQNKPNRFLFRRCRNCGKIIGQDRHSPRDWGLCQKCMKDLEIRKDGGSRWK